MYRDGLASMHSLDLCLFEVGRNPDVIGLREREQLLPGSDLRPDLHLLVPDHTVFRRVDVGVLEIQFGLIQLRFGGQFGSPALGHLLPLHRLLQREVVACRFAVLHRLAQLSLCLQHNFLRGVCCLPARQRPLPVLVRPLRADRIAPVRPPACSPAFHNDPSHVSRFLRSLRPGAGRR